MIKSVAKYILYELVPPLRFRDKNLAGCKKAMAVFETFVMLLFVTLIAVHYSFPYFTKKFTYHQLTFYVNDENVTQEQINTLAQKALSGIKDDPLYDAVDTTIYIANNPWLYALLVPSGFTNLWKSAAGTFGSSIFFKKIDFTKVVAQNGSHFEKAYAVLAHELVHTLQFHRYGFWAMMFGENEWAVEGYATYVTRKLYTVSPKSILHKTYLETFGQKHVPPIYMLFALMTEHTLKRMHYTIDDLHSKKADYDTVYEDMMKYYKIKK